MKISLIIPVYNAEKHIKDCLQSIINQNFHSLEVIVVDDGSVDSSKEIIHEILKTDSRVKYFHKENSGVSDARNFGLSKACGEYIWFVDSDDLISPNFLNELFSNNSNSFDLIQFSFYKFSDLTFKVPSNENIVINPIIYDFSEKLLVNASYARSLWRNIFKRDFLLDNNLSFVSGLRFGEDLLFTIEAIILSQRIWTTEAIGYYYRNHEDSVMNRERTLNDALQHIIILTELIKIYKKTSSSIKRDFLGKEIQKIATTLVSFCAVSKNKIDLKQVQNNYNTFYDNEIYKGNYFLKDLLRLRFMRISIYPIYLASKFLKALGRYS